MLKGQNVSITICLTFCCRLLLSGSWFSVSPIQWFPETKEVPIMFFIWALPTQQMLTVSVGALATSLGLAISGQSDKLRTHCCKVIVVWGQCGTSFPSVMLRGRGAANGCCAILQLLLFPIFFTFLLWVFLILGKKEFSQLLPLFCTTHSPIPLSGTSLLYQLFNIPLVYMLLLLFPHPCSALSVLFNRLLPPSYAPTSKWGSSAAQHSNGSY